MNGVLRGHWETVVLLGVAVLCAFSISALNGSPAASTSVVRTTIEGLTAKGVEDSVLTVQPGAPSSLSVSSGHRANSFSIDLANGVHGSITVGSALADGAVTSVTCGADSTPDRPLTVAANSILNFCATLPATGAGTDTAAWIDQQFAVSGVGFSKSQNHSGVQYALSYSQYDNDRTHYEVTVLPPLRS